MNLFYRLEIKSKDEIPSAIDPDYKPGSIGREKELDS